MLELLMVAVWPPAFMPSATPEMEPVFAVTVTLFPEIAVPKTSPVAEIKPALAIEILPTVMPWKPWMMAPSLLSTLARRRRYRRQACL